MRANLSVWVDESESGDLLAIGGVVLDWNSIPAVCQGWRGIKRAFRLPPGAEVKWSLPRKHETREILEKEGYATKQLLEEAISFISQQELKCIVCIMIDERKSWLNLVTWGRTTVRHFYCEGLRYVLQRVAEECSHRNGKSCTVICDTPGLGSDKIRLRSVWYGPKAVEDAYAKWYAQGVGFGPGSKDFGSLESLGFHPSVLIGDASYHDMLQIADVVVGATRQWVVNVRDSKGDAWIIQQIKKLSAVYRKDSGKPDFWGDGLVIWPRNPGLWQALKDSLN
ncbi:MAG: hypothetical protein RML74_00025 [Acidobacteriota bacterium]|nr:hypothetical protein [Acidobacteriota bacterium]